MPNNDLPRRQFLRGEFLASLQSHQIRQQGFLTIRPPWAMNEKDFTTGCTRCGDCIQVCETQILIKGRGDFPEVNFAQGECTFCQRCVEACEQPIFYLTKEVPWLHKIEILDHCLANKQVECRGCADSCEMRAIQFKPTLGGIAQIVLDKNSCNGCGACIKSCVVSAIKICYPRDNKE